MAPLFGFLELASWRRLLLICLTFVAVVLYVHYLQKPQEEELKLLNILCFGDSLTEGMTNRSTRIFHPYSRRLQFRFDQFSEKGKHRKLSTTIHNAGVSGEVVQNSMERRLPKILGGNQRKYDWVIILGGTNDIRRRLWTDYVETVDSKMIFKALRGLHQASHKHGSKSAAVTIPARQCELQPECSQMKKIREQVNTWLREFSKSSGDRVVLVDLAREMEFPKFRRYWSDDVHFTKEGYDKMGDVIFDALQPHLS